MQPHRRGDEAESKASCSVDKGPGEGAGGEQCKIEGLKLAHGIPQLSPPRLARAGDGATLGLLQLGGGCLDLPVSMDTRSANFNRNWAEFASPRFRRLQRRRFLRFS